MKVDPALCRHYANLIRSRQALLVAERVDIDYQLTAAAELAEIRRIESRLLDDLRALRFHWSEANASRDEMLGDVDRLLRDGLPQALGSETAAIILQALDYWNRDLTAPHAQIAEIRKLIEGGS